MSARGGLRANIEAYERRRDELEREHHGKYVVFHEAKFADAFDTSEQVIMGALERFGVAPYLIRRVGGPRKMQLPTSLALGQNRVSC